MSRGMAHSASPGLIWPLAWRPKLSVGLVACYVLLGLLGLFVIYPVYLLIHDAFTVTDARGVEAFAIDHWVKVWSERGLVRAIVNTIYRAVVTIGISLPIAILLAWLVARTDMPGKGFIIGCAWVAYFMPTLPVLLGWILLLDPQYGLLNKLLQGWFGFTASPFRLYPIKLKDGRVIWPRSRIERIIAEALDSRGVNFVYEPTDLLEGWGLKPDFKIDLENGKTYYLEHLGLMNKAWYRDRWFTKLGLYEASGHIEDLVTTSEAKMGSDIGENLAGIIDAMKEGKLRATVGYSKHHYEI